LKQKKSNDPEILEGKKSNDPEIETGKLKPKKKSEGKNARTIYAPIFKNRFFLFFCWVKICRRSEVENCAARSEIKKAKPSQAHPPTYGKTL